MSGYQAHFEIYPDKSGDWRWRLRAANGRVVADGAEGYASKRNVNRAIGSLFDAVDHARASALCIEQVPA